MEKTMIYYRPYSNNGELLTEEQYKRFCDVFDEKNEYFGIEKLAELNDSGSGIHTVNNIMLTIQTDSKLNASEALILDRISRKKGKLTPSKRDYIGNSSVEVGLIYDLVEKAVKEINSCSDPEDRIKWNEIPYREILRLYNIPYKGVMSKVEEAEKNIEKVSEPKVKYKLKYKSSGAVQPLSVFQVNEIFVKKIPYSEYTFNKGTKELYKKFSYLGKVYYSTLFKPENLQINVYDKQGRDWAIQNIVHELVQMELIEPPEVI